MKTALAILLLAFSLATGNLFAQATFPNQSNGLTSGPSTARLYIPESLANAPAEVQATVASRDQMEQYLANNPGSAYAPKLRNALASGYRQSGRITAALNHWSSVWQQLNGATDSDSYNEANHALAGQLELLTMLGRVETLPGMLKTAEGRTISDSADRERIRAAREGYFMMLREPALNYRCGTLALAEIARLQGKPSDVINALIEEPSPQTGISLLRLLELSRQLNLGLVAVKRTDATPLPVPCVVHWSQNHYGALLDYNASMDCYRTIFGQPNFMSGSDVNAEASGYFLIPADQKPAAWPIVSDAECGQVLGRSFIYTMNDSKDKGCKVDPTNPKSKCPSCEGMAAWWVTEPYINLFLADEPVGYGTSRGEKFNFRITVKQRDSLGTVYQYPRPGLLHNWYSRIYIQGMPVVTTQYVTNYDWTGTNIIGITTNYPPVYSTNGFSSWNATVDLPTGGQVNYYSSSNWSSSYDEETRTRLLPAYGNVGDGTIYPVPGFQIGSQYSAPDSLTFPRGSSANDGYGYLNDGASGFRILHSDGSLDRFGLVYWRSNGVSGYYECEALLTQHRDPVGNNVNLFYGLYTNSSSVACFRLTQVVDYDNNTNNFTYFSSNPGLLQQITTPYGQTATFAYDGSGNLTNITDACQNRSGFAWDNYGRVKTLTTPYGKTSFSYYDADLPGTNDSTLNGDVAVDRSIAVSDPAGGVSIYAYCFNSQNETPSQFASSVVPQGTPVGTLDLGTNEIGHDYAAACFRNSFYWNARQSLAVSTTNVSLMKSNDFALARMQHWLGDSNNVTQTSLLSVEQDPSPDGYTPGQLTFYDYYGKSLHYLQGTNSQIAVSARRQPSGNTQYTWDQYNFDGYVTRDINTYSAADGSIKTRTNLFTYGNNIISFTVSNSCNGLPVGLDFLNAGAGDAVNGPSAPMLGIYESASNTCGVWSFSVASGASVTLQNILLQSVNAAGYTNSYGGYQTVTKTLLAHTYTAWPNQTLWTHLPWLQYNIESYVIPLPTKITNAVGYVTASTYDGNNRLTSVHSPSGLTTTNGYDSNGFLSQVVDLELGRTNSYTYQNGLVRTETNERGLVTTYTWDNLRRLLSKSDQEGYVSNVYSKLDLTAVKDKVGNWTYYGYDPLRHMVAITNNANKDVRLASFCSCGALEWTRDGITNYTVYTYDYAGRVTGVQYADGYTVTNVYNSLNQLVKTSDPLGFTTNIYNLQGLLVLSANGAGLIQSNSYDVLDRQQGGMDNRGVVTRLLFDGLDRVLTNIVVGVATNTFSFAGNGLVSVVDGLRANTTYFTNDPMGRVLSRADANGVTRFQLDSSGNTTNIIDAKLQNTWFQFDGFNRVTNKLDNNKLSVLQLTYDANGQVKSRTTPQYGTISFIRDASGRVRTNVYPHDAQVVFTYDSNGRLITMTDGLGTTASTYSPLGQLQTSGGLWPNDVVTVTYSNELRNTLTVGSFSETYGYDNAHRLHTINAVSGNYTYTYNSGLAGSSSSSLIQKLSLPNAMTITNGFDAGGRFVATVLLNSNSVPFDSEQYTYDADGRRLTETRYDNSVATYTYDGIGQLKTATSKEAGATTRLNEQFGYSYDKAGNLYARTNNTLVLTFNVNSVNQLSNSAYSGSLTAAGNTAQAVTSATVNGQNSALYGDKTFAVTAGLSPANGANTFTTVVQYAAATVTNVSSVQLPTSVSFLYDADGNLTNDGWRSFSYDDQDRLTSITIPGQCQSVFFYDGLGRRRISRDFGWNGAWVLTNEVHYIYDGKLVIQEWNTNNLVLASYDRGLDLSGSLQGAGGAGGLLARSDIKGTIYYHSDAQGNVMALVDRYQTLEGRYLYDAYGNVIGKWGPYVDVNRYRYASMEYLPLYGVYNSYGRYYDPNLQRFLNRDPLGESGGINLYAYVGSNPINSIDPFGMCPWSWSRFGDWELGELTSAKEFFTGKPGDVTLDPNSLLYLSNQAGVGNTPLTDKDGNIVSATDLAFDVFTQPLIALATGGMGEILELGGQALAGGSDLVGLDVVAGGRVTELATGAEQGPATMSRFGTQQANSLAEFNRFTDEISYNRQLIRDSAAARGISWQQELYVSGYHEEMHALLKPVNIMVQNAFNLPDIPYFQWSAWKTSEEWVAESYGQIRGTIRYWMR